jgi:hypothetical protein
MSGWQPGELDRLGNADEVAVASVRGDGTLRPFVTIWAVGAGDELYVRSAYGPDNPWFRRAREAGRGRIRGGGVERDVTFEVPGPEVADEVTAAYHAKYDRYGESLVSTVVSPEAIDATLRATPAEPEGRERQAT